MHVTAPRAEHRTDPLGLGESRPRLSWTTATDRPGWRQSAYEIEAGTERFTAESAESVLVPWPFAPLTSRQRVQVRVRVRSAEGDWSGWSPPAAFEAGLLHPADWSARFVSPPADEHLLRGDFTVRQAVTAARLHVTALGVYEAELNGVRVGDHVLAPGWTSYHHRLRYQTFDVTGLIRPGPNTLGAVLADGWYRGRLGFEGGATGIYGDRLALLAQLELTFADGGTRTFGTGPGWRCAAGPLIAASIYDGETHDARLEVPGWSSPAPPPDPATWRPVEVVEHDLATLVAPTGPPVRRTGELAPVEVLTSPSGRTVLDFGQNLVGRLRITAEGAAGERVVLRHAEVLEEGEPATRLLRTAAATDVYVLRGGGPEVWEPRFTFHGFRYASVEGPADPGLVRAVVCHTDMPRTGRFECSDPLVERLHENAVWSMRGNFLDLPTDCPQRDERLGWTGDLQVFAPTAAFLYDCAGLLESWLADVAAEQAPSGAVPVAVPNVLGERSAFAAAGWGDAIVLVPWTLYRRYGDAGLLERCFPAMCRYVDHVAELAGPSRLWTEGYQFGDWLDPAAPPDRPGAGRTPKEVVATAYLAHSAGVLARAAEVLGRDAERERYQALAAAVGEAFAAAYVRPEGTVLGDSATGYALALTFGLLPEPGQREFAGRRLAEVIAEGGHRIATGFLGTPLVCDALTEAGQVATAYRLLLQRECPSWLYAVTMGGTTIWERWDSLRPDGTVNLGEMTSFNHYALGAVADWLHRCVAGLAPAAPGYRRLLIRPRPGGGLTRARAALRTPYGPAEAAWRLDGEQAGELDGGLEVTAVVPPNTSALVHLPGAEPFEVGSGRHRWTVPGPGRPSGSGLGSGLGSGGQSHRLIGGLLG
ncbi:family 78 glycoside hydrolase catalytic domain [Nonomuraea sp. NPDC050328]|uniref:family 78 glycoside hydrolase catalytic domain n=1 Tax=Nonomuraea sp. NPDC050328 TaxID=3364361 RepID=UPI0037A444F6